MNILGSGFLHITDKLTSSSFKSTSLLPDWLVVGFWLRIVHNRSHILILLLTTFLCWYLHLGLCDHVRPHGSVEEVLCRSALWKERFCTEESSQGWWGSTRLMLTEHINLSGGPLTVYLCVCYLGCGLLWGWRANPCVAEPLQPQLFCQSSGHWCREQKPPLQHTEDMKTVSKHSPGLLTVSVFLLY